PKKRAATVSPKKGTKAAEEADAEAMEDIESEERAPEEGEKGSTLPPTPKRSRRQQTPEAAQADEEALPVLDDGEEMEEIIVTRDDEDEDGAFSAEAAPTLYREGEEPAAGAADELQQPQPRVAPTAKVGVVAATIPSSGKEPTTPNRRVPRLKMETEVSDDVKAAQAVEDAAERDGVRQREKKTPMRRATSPARTRAFTSAATLSTVMRESKARLKQKKIIKKEEGEAAAEGDEEQEVEVDVENDESGEPQAVGSESENTCTACNARFPIKLEMIEHQMAHHKNEFKHMRERGGLMMCAHPHCGLSLAEMPHLLAHLAGFHNQTNFRIRQQHFASEDAFMTWKQESEEKAKSNYIARNEEIEIEPGVTELELYCECSEEWRNADKSKSLSPIVACPAHFTVRLDRNKDKVSIIGCTAHLGHLKKPNWSVYVSDESMARRAQGAAQNKQSKCHICHDWFRSRTALTLHRRTAHPDNIRTATITCGDSSCEMVVDTMLALCEHVADAHKREDLVVEEYRFNSISDFEVWKERMEADTMSYFTKVSGRQRAAASGPNSECFFRYYQCHLSGYNQRPGAKKMQEEMDRIKIRNRGTKKMNRYCTAFMNIKINDADGSVLLKGCLGHFGHDCDIRRVPMPPSLRAEIVDLLQKGVTEDDVLAIVKGKASIHDRAYYLQKYEVKNIVKKLIKEGNGAVFYKYDDDEELGMEDEMADWQEMKRPYQSTMYRSMINHPKRRAIGTYALQFSAQMPRKRRLVYRTEGDEHNPDGEEYYESVVEEMAADMDEHVTYLDESELDASSSVAHHHHMVQQEGDEEEQQHPEEQHEMHEEDMVVGGEASTSSAPMVVRRRKLPAGVVQQAQAAVGTMRTPLLKDGSERVPVMDRDRHFEFNIHNIRRKIMYLTEQQKRCKDPSMSAQMQDEVRMHETRIARLIPQTGPGRLSQTMPYMRRGETGGRGGRVTVGVGRQEETEPTEEYYEEEMVEEDNRYYELDDGRPGPSTLVVPRSVQRAYGHHEVIYQDVGSPGVEVDVEDLEEIEEGDVMHTIDG
ncbi:hypothetical protein PFISCL1PPCAC_23195, partial [Pristionchus fissidentatus]